MALAAAALAACTQGPEGRGRRVPIPDTTPATEQALAGTVHPDRAPCILNRAGLPVEFTLESDGKVRRYTLHDDEAIRFRDSGKALVRFASAADVPAPHLRSRFYLLDLDRSSTGCRYVFRLDASGGVDLFGSGVQ